MCDVSDLGVEEACLLLAATPSLSSEVMSLKWQSSECIGCPLIGLGTGPWYTVDCGHSSHVSVVVSSENKSEEVMCTTQLLFQSHSIYTMNASCSMSIERKPSMTPNALLALLLSLLALLLCALRLAYRSRPLRRLLVAVRPQVGPEAVEREEETEVSSVISADLVSDLRLLSDDNVHYQLTRQQRRLARDRKKRSRLRALDTFRGLSVAMMIFVNYGGGGYTFFEHSVWNGINVADLVFPAFVWAMGISVVLSIHAQLRNGLDRRRIAKRAFRRSIILVLLGLFINARSAFHIDNKKLHDYSNEYDYNNEKATDLGRLRIPSVLQRIGVAYAIAMSMALFTVPRDLNEPQTTMTENQVSLLRLLRKKLERWIPDLTSSFPELVLIFLLASVHTLVTFLMPLPHPCPTGYVGPGGLHAGGMFFNCTGGAAGLIDRLLLGQTHIYEYSSAKRVYKSGFNHDPEGLLGNLTCSMLALLGVMAGKILLYFTSCKHRVLRWSLWAAALGIGGLLLCGFDAWGSNGIIPANKHLWSLSFVLITAALSTLIFAVLYVLIDVLGVYRGIPFYYLGMNAIIVYVGHLVCKGCFPFAWEPLFRPVSHLELLLMHLWAVGLWCLIAYALFKANFFLAL